VLFLQKKLSRVFDMIRHMIFLILLLTAGCGGGSSSGSSGSSGSSAPSPLAVGSFWAVDFSKTTPAYYELNATKVGEGNNCYIYVEQAPNVPQIPQSTINDIISQFDSAIHPDENTAFGSEPNPGIDADPKIYILLLNVRDGFNAVTSTSYIAGYFDPISEYSFSQNSHSNQKEIIFMNINTAARINPDSVDFFATIAHEFQHMIHWEQKTHLQPNLPPESTWIDEAMAQVARDYCGYGPDYSSVFAYEHDLSQNVNHSLVNFDKTVGNYGMVYMWALYMKDQFDSTAGAVTGHTLFWNMLHNSSTGVTEINDALAAINSSKNFTSAFRDWAIANFFGNGTAPQSDWSYVSVDTRPGKYIFNNGENTVTLPGLFPTSTHNPATIQPPDQWSINYYSFTPVTSTPTVIWTRGASAATTASFINGNNGNTPVVTFNMVSGTLYPFAGTGYLIYENPSSTSQAPVDTIVHTAVNSTAVSSNSLVTTGIAATTKTRTPHEMLATMNSDPTAQRLVQQTGKPLKLYVDSWFRDREKELRNGGVRPPF
jgi:hypothetical protein